MSDATPTVIVSYSHDDRDELAELKRFLSPLEREGSIDYWDDNDIPKGTEWEEEIERKLDAASVAVLLITQDFIASNFIAQKEVPRLLPRHLLGSLLILPIFLRPSTVKTTEYSYKDPRTGERATYCLDRIQGFGSPDGKTLSDMDKNERAREYIDLHGRLVEIIRNQPVQVQTFIPSHGLYGNEVFQENFGHLEPSKRDRAREHFESLKASLAQESRYLMGDEETTLKCIIKEHYAAYFQGNRHFLKLQTYQLPVGAQEVRAVAISDDAASSFFEENSTWVVTGRKGKFRRINLLEDGAGKFWRLAPVFEDTWLHIVSFYSDANPIAANNIMDVWIELEELAGLCSLLTVAYGGKVSNLSLQNAYYFPARRNLRFYAVDTSGLQRPVNPRQETVTRFTAVMDYLEGTNALQDEKGILVRELWHELQTDAAQEWQAVQIPDVRADMLLIVTGTT